eukprot:CAMPEP_0198127618 /NCGR_PEP_ID=MMETSP1442-20131203/47586_1 /TAXON_ID= /ORGANISM="Craspedostauros australis, Strain CCMP3328" /LENGTH=199 /DNA_ID=CAMNT_0043787621 /DNA_START=122 /DNA_END=721 /DNA_ORIENTATION=+
MVGFSCGSDVIPKPDDAFIEAGSDGTLFFSGLAVEGDIFDIPIPDGVETIDITILDEEGGNVIQELTGVSTLCRNQDGLRLLDTFGSLQLLGYEAGDEFAFIKEVIEFTYIIRNPITLEATLFSGLRALTAANSQPPVQLVDTPVSLFRDDEFRSSERFTINLLESQGRSVSAALAAVANSTISGLECRDRAILVVSVA